jgi:hypothetical protein
VFQPQWTFKLIEGIHPNHIVAIALGPVDEATPSFKRSLLGAEEQLQESFENSEFIWLTVDDIFERLQKQ